VYAVDYTQLTDQEQKQVQQSIQQFYQAYQGESSLQNGQQLQQMRQTMQQQIQKYNAQTGQQVQQKKKLVLQQQQQQQIKQELTQQIQQDPSFKQIQQLVKDQKQVQQMLQQEVDWIQQQGQQKLTQNYQQQYCKQFLQKRFPKLKCQTWEPGPKTRAAIQANDKVEDLVETWVTKVNKNIGNIKSAGQTKSVPWSDDYWRLRWGATSFRYSKGEPTNPSYKAVMKLYSQPGEFESLGRNAESIVATWSPAEKYDVTVGDKGIFIPYSQ
jgi:hypothetical protein